MKLIDFELTTPERVVVQEKVRQVSIPTTEGEITVLAEHVPLIAPIRAGELRIVHENGQDTLIAVAGGFVTIHPGNRLAVLADSAERAEELDLKVIEDAKSRAEELLKQKFDDSERLAEAETGLARELARLHVVRKHRSRRQMPHLERSQE